MVQGPLTQAFQPRRVHSTEERTALVTALGARPIVAEPGEVLLRDGERSRRMYLLEKGAVEISRTDATGTCHVLATLGPGQLFGEISLLRGTPNSANATAVEQSELLEVSAGAFAMFEQTVENPTEEFLLLMARNLSGALLQSSDGTVESMRRELELSKVRDVLASFLVHILLGFAAYAVVMKALAQNQVSLSNATVVTGPLMLGMCAVAVSWARKSGLPKSLFGMTWANAGRNALEAVLFSVPAMAVLVLAKWIAIQNVPHLADEPLFSAFAGPFDKVDAIGYVVYAALVPLQEFLSRGVIQGPLYELLTGSPRRRMAMAIIVSNTLFAITHLHLTLGYGAAAFIGGLFWGWLQARQRSLVGPIVSHIVIGVFALWALGLADVFKGLSG